MSIERDLARGEAALLLIDVQQGFDDPQWGARNNPHAEEALGRVLAWWRERGGLVVHIRHHSRSADSPLRPGQPGSEFKQVVRPLTHELVVTKHVNSGFIGTNLEALLRERGITTVIVGGVQTNHCVETTTRMAGNLGFRTYVLADGTWTYDKRGPDGRLHSASDIHEMSLVNLHDEFATVITSIDLMAPYARNHKVSSS